MGTTLVASLIVAGALAVAGLAAVGIVATEDGGVSALFGAGADADALHGGHAGDAHNAQLGMERPRWPEATGSVPSAEEAQSLEEVSFIDIQADHEFTPESGVRSGSGTLEDPYVISGYHVTGDLYVADTDACFVVAENFIDGQLTLNWNGQCVWVHHNYIRDLRVNENVARTGYATGGLLEANQITFIGQIRHYDGEFRNNEVGPFTPSDIFDTVLETTPLIGAEVLVANVDGFNQGLFHHNTFFGSVNLDLHGHHHGTGFFAPHSHYHGDNMTKMALHEHDHSDRWTSVAFTDNKIVDEKGYGLLYDDQNHAGDDRTANSENVEALEGDHQHHTMVEISRNAVEGAGIWIDIFNADDEYHTTENPGWLTVADNQVTVRERPAGGPLGLGFFDVNYRPNVGIYLWAAKEVQVTLERNTLSYIEAPEDPQEALLRSVAPFLYYEEEPAGILLDGVRDADVTVTGNTVSGFLYGVRARDMDANTTWVVEENDFGATPHPVWYDESVANQPQTDEDVPEASEDEHDHGEGGETRLLSRVLR